MTQDHQNGTLKSPNILKNTQKMLFRNRSRKIHLHNTKSTPADPQIRSCGCSGVAKITKSKAQRKTTNMSQIMTPKQNKKTMKYDAQNHAETQSKM